MRGLNGRKQALFEDTLFHVDYWETIMRSLIICLMLATASMTVATVVSAVPAQATMGDRKAPFPIHYRTA